MTGDAAGVETCGRPPGTTHELVARVALDLFVRRGFEETTIEDIASALGVPPRTVMRYYASTSDIVWGEFDRVPERLRVALDIQDDEVPVVEAVTAAMLSCTRYPAAQLPDLRERMILIITVPTLQADSMVRYAAWRAVLAGYAGRRWDVDPDELEPQTLAFAAVGAAIAAFTTWAHSGGDLESRLASAYGALRAGFRRPEAAPGAADLSRQYRVDEIARALPARLAELASLFLKRATAVSRTDVRVLQRLAREPHRITQLAAEEQIKQPSMTLLVNRLEERGWATREPDPSDGRAVLVSLTPAGTSALHSLQAAYHEMLAGHMAAVDDDELQSLSQAVTVLDDLISRLKAESPA